MNINKYAKIAFAICIISVMTLFAVSCDFFSSTPLETSRDTDESLSAECDEHQESDWIVDADATCSSKGSKHKECITCGEILETEDVEMLAHTEKIVEGRAATCSEEGLTQGKKCSVCDAVIIPQDMISALGHSESDWIIDLTATADTEGKKHKECTRCELVLFTEAIPTISVDHVHSGTSWTVTKPATCVETGIISLICECGETIDTQITAKTNNHTEETILGKAPTCNEAGTTDGKKCSVCGTITASQMLIAPKGHSFIGGVCTSCGFKGNYGVWITDGLGNPMTDIIVKVLKDGEVVKMSPYNGQYTTFDLEDGDYTVELDLSLLSEEYVYDTSSCTISTAHKSLSIKLYRAAKEAEDPIYVSSPIDADYKAQYITEGSYKVSLTPNDYSFFIFAPEVAAIYTITYECDSDLTVSYHGGTFFVQGNDISKDNSDFSKYGNGLSFSIYPSNIGASYVFAVKSNGATECVLNIQNAGDPGTRLVDQPWTPYQESASKIEEMKNYPKDGTFVLFDVANTSLSAVLNPEDGYYHLGSEDGPVIFIDLTTDSKYIASIFTICAHQRMGTYIYDNDGNVVEKRSYNELFIQCGMPDPMEATSAPTEPVRVPLTEKLAEAVKAFGDKNGWWSDNEDTNIFTRVLLGAPYNQEYAWLLYCGYYE